LIGKVWKNPYAQAAGVPTALGDGSHYTLAPTAEDRKPSTG